MINRGQLFIDLMSVSAMNVILIDIKQDAYRSRSINNAHYPTRMVVPRLGLNMYMYKCQSYTI